MSELEASSPSTPLSRSPNHLYFSYASAASLCPQIILPFALPSLLSYYPAPVSSSPRLSRVFHFLTLFLTYYLYFIFPCAIVSLLLLAFPFLPISIPRPLPVFLLSTSVSYLFPPFLLPSLPTYIPLFYLHFLDPPPFFSPHLLSYLIPPPFQPSPFIS